MTVRGSITRAVTRWRRWRLLRSYMDTAHHRRVGEGRSSVRGGFVNYLIALDQLESDGLITIDEDGDVTWLWPDQETPEDRETPEGRDHADPCNNGEHSEPCNECGGPWPWCARIDREGGDSDPPS